MKMNKRWLSVLLCVVLAVTLLAVTTSAAGGATNVEFVVEKTEVTEGETFTVTLRNKAMTVKGFSAGFTFDNTLLECVSIVGPRGEARPNYYYLVDAEWGDKYLATAVSDLEKANSSGTVGFAYIGTSDTGYEAGLLFVVTFRAKATGTANFTLYEESNGTDAFKSDSIETKTVTIKEAAPACEHKDASKYTYEPNADKWTHAVTCDCGEVVKAEETHDYDNTAGTCAKCKFVCDHDSNLVGSAPTEIVSNGNDTHAYWYLCDCGIEYKDGDGECFGGEATCNKKAICSECNTAYGEVKGDAHTNNSFRYDNNNNGTHTKYCNDCDTPIEVEGETNVEHTYGDKCTCVCGATNHEYTYACDQYCKNCEELTNEDAAHNVIHVEAKAPTCTENGNIEYWYCEYCGSAWLDVDCTMVTNLQSVKLGATCATNAIHSEGVEPDCHYTGWTENWYCANCDVYYLDADCTIITNYKSLTIPALQDTAEYVPAKDATCTEGGNVEYWICYECEQVWADEALTQLTNIQNVQIATDADNHASNKFTYVDNGNGTHTKKHACCGTEIETVEHSYVMGECYYCTHACDHSHGFSGVRYTTNGDGTHKLERQCDSCYLFIVVNEKEACSGGTATCTALAKCDACGGEYGSLLEHGANGYVDHFWGSVYGVHDAACACDAIVRDISCTDANGNHRCDYCNQPLTMSCYDAAGDGDHKCDNANCEVFSYEYVVNRGWERPDFGHTVTHVGANAPTCTEAGNVEYWICYECGEVWADEALTQLTNIQNVQIDKDADNHASDEVICISDDADTHTVYHSCCRAPIETVPHDKNTVVDLGNCVSAPAYICTCKYSYRGDQVNSAVHAAGDIIRYKDITADKHTAYHPCCNTDIETVAHTYVDHVCVCEAVEKFTLTVIDMKGNIHTDSVPFGTDILEAIKAMNGIDISSKKVNSDTMIGEYIFAAWVYANGEADVAKDDTVVGNVTIKPMTSANGWMKYQNGWQYHNNGAVVNTTWMEIDGAWYYFDANGFRAEGLNRVPYPTVAINGITYAANAADKAYWEAHKDTSKYSDATTAVFYFGADGKFVQYSGIEGKSYFINGMAPWHVGFVKNGNDYYYFVGDKDNGGNTMATGKIYATRDYNSKMTCEGKIYFFGADGKLLQNNEGEIKDGKYYLNGELAIGLGVVQLMDENGESYFIYVRSNGELATGEYWPTTRNGLLASGRYDFGEDGRLYWNVSADYTGIKDGIYYKNGRPFYAGLIEIEGATYYINSKCEVVTGWYYVTKTNEIEIPTTKLFFGEDGKLQPVKDGIVKESNVLYYYENNHLKCGAGVVEMTDAQGNTYYIYVKSNGQLATGEYWPTTTNGLLKNAKYNWGTDGKYYPAN